VWGRLYWRVFQAAMTLTQYDDSRRLIVCPYFFFFLCTLLIERGVTRASLRVFASRYLLESLPHTYRCFFWIFLNLFYSYFAFHFSFLSMVTRCGLLCCSCEFFMLLWLIVAVVGAGKYLVVVLYFFPLSRASLSSHSFKRTASSFALIWIPLPSFPYFSCA
jgi:hypothetical protein